MTTATWGDKKVTAITDLQGVYSFPDQADGSWTIEVGMQGFSTIKQGVVIAPKTSAAHWELRKVRALVATYVAFFYKIARGGVA
jgi:hypothetical protein